MSDPSTRSYTGHVEPDGEAIQRRDGDVVIRKFSVGSMDNNVYVVADADSREALVVDAAARPEVIREQAADFSPRAVVQTHGHRDHVRAWEALAADPGWEIWGHRGDAELFPAAADRWLEDGQRIEVGGLDVEVLHTPGHTAGSIQLLVRGDERPHLISGDSLFPGGPGKTTGTRAFEQLMNNLEERVFGPLPDDTWVYPGHGDDTTLGEERPKLDDWWQRGW